ncbi:MAG: PLP-dependent aminotransferase family protein, partial [Dehalococcoidia bacterium]
PPISLAGGMPDAATQPREALLDAMRRALDTEDDSPLVYGGPWGYHPLREEIGRYFGRDHREPLSAEHYVLTNGAAGAIDLVCSALLDPGDVVITEVPTFAGSLRTLRGHGAEIVGVRWDDEGLDLDALQATIERVEAAGGRIKLLYTIPTFHNPTGRTATIKRRVGLVELAATHGIFILEDTAYADLYFGEEPIPSLSAIADGHGVFTAGTFSKVIATGLRVGWVQARPELAEAILPARFDMGNSPLLHRMLYQYMASGEFERHVKEMRALYARKMQTLTSALREFAGPYLDFTDPGGGFFLWLRLRRDLSARKVQVASREEGALFPFGSVFYPNGDTGGDGECVRLAYSWTAEADLAEGAARLARACEKVAAE